MQQLQAWLELLPDAALLVDRDGRIVFANTQAEGMFGYAPHVLVGQAVEALIPSRLQSQHVQDRERYAAAPHKRAMGAGMDLYALRRDGAEIPVDIALGPLNVEGRALVLSVIRDITERKRVETHMKQEKQELERVNQLMMDREDRVMELKKEVNALCRRVGQPPKYTLA